MKGIEAGPSEPRGESALQWAWFVVLTWVVAGPSLRLPYFLDDFALLHEVARFRLGSVGFPAYLFGVHNEHTIPLLRLAVWASTSIAGTNPFPIRLAMVGLHALSAWAAGSLCARLSGRRAAAWIAGSVFAIAVGGTGSVLWNVTIGVFVLGGCGLALAIRSLVCGDPRRIWPALWWLIGGAAGLNGVAVAAAPLSLQLWQHPRRWRRIGQLLVVGVVVMIAARWNYSRFTAADPLPLTATGVANGLLLIALAPARIGWGFLPFPLPSLRLGLILGIAGWALLAASLLRLEVRQRRIVTILWSVPIAISALVGMARARDPASTFLLTDRYFYLFLLPLAVHGGLILDRVWHARRSRPAGAIAAAIAGLALVGAHTQFQRGVMTGVVDRSLVAWDSWHRLTDLLHEAATRSPTPLAIPPGPVELPAFPAMEMSDLLLNSSAGQRVRFVYRREPLDANQSATLNHLLDDWSTSLPEKRSPVCVREGRLAQNRPPDAIDFSIDGYGSQVLGGFGEREVPGFRWMTEGGRLTLPAGRKDLLLRAAAPVSALRRVRPGFAGVRIHVAIDGAAAADLLVDNDTPQTFPVPRPPAAKSEGMTTIELTADQIWHAADIDARNLDPRTLSIALYFVGPTDREIFSGHCSPD